MLLPRAPGMLLAFPKWKPSVWTSLRRSFYVRIFKFSSKQSGRNVSQQAQLYGELSFQFVLVIPEFYLTGRHNSREVAIRKRKVTIREPLVNKEKKGRGESLYSFTRSWNASWLKDEKPNKTNQPAAKEMTPQQHEVPGAVESGCSIVTGEVGLSLTLREQNKSR